MSNPLPPSEAINRFVSNLEKLDAGGRAQLKRNVGRTLNEARDVYQVFFAALPPYITHEREQEDYFLIATLYAFGTRREDSRPSSPPPSLGASLRRVRQQIGDGSDNRQVSLDKRFGTLLDADREQMPFRLRQIVSLLAANQVAVDWRRLLLDVRRWEIGEGKVQRRWAEHYYVGTQAMSDAVADQRAVSPVATSPEESHQP